jgi:hypothetical protein
LVHRTESRQIDRRPWPGTTVVPRPGAVGFAAKTRLPVSTSSPSFDALPR